MHSSGALFVFLGGFATRYRRGRYRFPDGALSRETDFFAVALLDHLRATGREPGKLVFLGTSGSMWDAVAIGFGASAEGARDLDPTWLQKLQEAASASAVTQDEASSLAAVLARRLNISVAARVIPYARTQAEATAIVEAIVVETAPGGAISCDVTHGFRHLPMLALAACAIAETLRDARVEAIWYGAHDMASTPAPGAERDPSPVLRLDGYLDLLRWVRALSVFDVTGDLRGLRAPLPEAIGPLLESFGHHERLLQTEEAGRFARAARSALDTTSGVAPMFRDALEQRLAWVDEKALWRRQAALAQQHRLNGDIALATLLLYEAAVSRHIDRHPGALRSDPKFGPRHAASNDLAEGASHAPVRQAFRRLRDLRNTIAHSTPPSHRKDEVKRALRDGPSLRRTFDDLRNALFSQDASWP